MARSDATRTKVVLPMPDIGFVAVIDVANYRAWFDLYEANFCDDGVILYRGTASDDLRDTPAFPLFDGIVTWDGYIAWQTAKDAQADGGTESLRHAFAALETTRSACERMIAEEKAAHPPHHDFLAGCRLKPTSLPFTLRPRESQ